MLSLVGIIVGLALLIFLAFRGKSLLWAAPVCALLVAFTGGLDMFTAYTQNYMDSGRRNSHPGQYRCHHSGYHRHRLTLRTRSRYKIND